MNALPLDHMAFRVKDRDAALVFLSALGYEVQADFLIELADGSTARSYALKHPSSIEIFVSSGPEGSLIDNWVDEHGGRGAIHHLAYCVEDVATTMRQWESRGIEFCTPEPIVCPCEEPLTQVFTRPDPSTGIIYELINRGTHMGFCPENVKRLMSTSKKTSDE